MSLLLERFQFHVRRGGGAPATVPAGGRGAEALTYAELDDLSLAMAGFLMARGFGPGMTAGALMNRSPRHIAAMLAVHRCGGVFFCLHPADAPGRIERILANARPGYLFTDSAGWGKLSGCSDPVLSGVRVIHCGGRAMPVRPVSLLGAGDASVFEAGPERIPGSRLPEPADDPSAPAMVIFTSGSTGSPKGVSVSLENMNARIEGEIAAYGLGPGDRLLGALPFSFDVGLNQLHSALASGAALYLLGSPLPADLAAAMTEYGITGISGVPALWMDFLLHREAAGVPAPASLRYITVSGGAMPEERLWLLRRALPATGIFKTYGQTETFRTTMLTPDEFEAKTASAGRALPGVSARIARGDGVEAAPGESGEIVHQGTGTMLEYLNDPVLTAGKLRRPPFPDSTFQGPAVFTGDAGCLDADGYLYIEGRMDSMVKIRGHRVYPSEIEHAALEHPAVGAAAALGTPRADGDAEIVLFVEGFDGDPAGLRGHLSRRLPKHMLPAHIEAVSSIPRTSPGKTDYAVLAKIAAEERAGGGES